MGKSVTVDGNLVRLNGEKVARVLGDFSAQVLADALRLYLRHNQPELPGAPQELVEKAREYVPTGQIGLLRLYADKRGFSCRQVDAAISMVEQGQTHAKRL